MAATPDGGREGARESKIEGEERRKDEKEEVRIG